MPDSADKVARQYGLNPKQYRQALRKERFTWHKPNTIWKPPDGSPEHQDMIRVAKRMASNHYSNRDKELGYKRILLKISGEALMGPLKFGIHSPTVARVAGEIKRVHDLGTEICMVIGGGNIFRGLEVAEQGIPRTTADHMGMLATVMNALAMQTHLEKLDIQTRVLSAIRLDEMCEPYILRRSLRHLEKQRVCIFAAGTGNPFFTTDTAATLRASELYCDAVFKGTKVNGVYDKDPVRNPDAERYGIISYEDVIQKDLRVMDTSAIAMARDNNLPIIVFSLEEPGGFEGIIKGLGTYSVIKNN